MYESIWHRPSEQRVDATYAYRGRGGSLNREIVVRQRYLLASAVESTLVRAGFELMSLSGDFEGSSYDLESEQLVIVARAR